MNIIIRSAEEKDLDNIIDYQIQMALETEEIHLDRATLVEGVRTAFSDISQSQNNRWQDNNCIKTLNASTPHLPFSIILADSII